MKTVNSEYTTLQTNLSPNMYKYSFALILLSGLFFAGFVLSKTVFADTPQNQCQSVIDGLLQKGWRHVPTLENMCEEVPTQCVTVLSRGNYVARISSGAKGCSSYVYNTSN
jgi:hypothetical protein